MGRRFRRRLLQRQTRFPLPGELGAGGEPPETDADVIFQATLHVVEFLQKAGLGPEDAMLVAVSVIAFTEVFSTVGGTSTPEQRFDDLRPVYLAAVRELQEDMATRGVKV